MNRYLTAAGVLAALLSSPLVSRAQFIDAEVRRGRISGRLMLAADGRPAQQVRVDLRPLTGGPVTTVFTDWTGEFDFDGLPSATYVLTVDDPSYEPIQETVHVGLSSGLGLLLQLKKASAAARPKPAGYVVSVRELSIPPKAQKEFQKGLERRAKNDPAGSLAHFQRAVAKLPAYYEAYFHMGLAFMELGQTTEAEGAIRKAIELSREGYADAYFALAELFSNRKEFADAEKTGRQGLALAPDSWQGHFTLGRALLGLNRAQEAEQSAQKARSLKADFASVYLLLANIHVRLENYTALLKDLDDYLLVDPDSAMAAKVRSNRENVQRALLQTQSVSTVRHDGQPKP